MSSESQISSQTDDKNICKQFKSFSNRSSNMHLPPYSHEYARAKHKAFERYKKIYPVQDKENIYPLTKTPNIGYYVMKGYRQEQNSLRESSQNNVSQVKSSDKMVTNLLKRYLERKEHKQAKMVTGLPKIDQNEQNKRQNRTSQHSRLPRATHMRVLTEYEEERRGLNL